MNALILVLLQIVTYVIPLILLLVFNAMKGTTLPPTIPFVFFTPLV
jgi:hypothetical protein